MACVNLVYVTDTELCFIFLWFDNDIWPNELSVLERHESLQNFMMIDLQKDPDILKKLAEVIEKTKHI